VHAPGDGRDGLPAALVEVGEERGHHPGTRSRARAGGPRGLSAQLRDLAAVRQGRVGR
jgi:hypothetical protein